MNLSRPFLNKIQEASFKPNVVVVFSPIGRFFTTTASNKPNSTVNYDGSRSYIFWKHEPDIILDTTEAKFSNHLTRKIGENVPLNCIDSVNISGSEIDLKDASTQDDNVNINLVLDNVGDKSLFQNLINWNVEVYLGFRDSAFQFEDYERFYVGALRGITSNSALSISLRVGNIADYWNKTWRHSRNLKPTKLAYDYPLNEAFQKEGDGDVTALSFEFLSWKPEWSLRQIGSRLKAWGFDFNLLPLASSSENKFFYRPPRRGVVRGFAARPKYGLILRDAKDKRFKTTNNGRTEIFIKNYEPFYPTSMFIFQPSGTIDHILETSPEIVRNRQTYPTVDEGFLNAIKSPRVKNRIRFKVDDTIVETEYIDSVAVFPYWAWASISAESRDSITQVKGFKNLINNVVRYPYKTPPTSFLERNYSLTGFHFLPKFLQFIKQEAGVSGTGVELTNTDPYDISDARVQVYGGPIPRFNFATKLKLFVKPEFEFSRFTSDNLGRPLPPTFSSGANVQFFDLATGVGKINEILIKTLTINLGISPNVLDAESFEDAIDNYFIGYKVPRDSKGNYLNSDYAFSGGEDDIVAHIEDKILKSNNLRLISDGGVLRCIYLGLNNLREKYSGDDPFVLSEDDILQNIVYETRHQDYISRLKIRAGFGDLESEKTFFTFYAHDNRSPDRTQGSIAIFPERLVPQSINELDHEEIDVFTNFTEGTALQSHTDNLGMVGNLFQNPTGQLYSRAILNTVTSFARDYFNTNNPFIRMTVVAGARAIGVDVGDVIVVRDHQALELFGSQFLKVLVVNKSINNWGTESLQVTLDCLFVSKSLDFLETTDVDAPTNLRLVSKERNEDSPYGITNATVTWNAPRNWGQDEDTRIRFYEVVEATASGERVLFKLPVENDDLEVNSYSWTANERSLYMFLNNPGTYHIFVRADNGVKKSPPSNILSIETFSTSTVPTAPLNLVGSVEERVGVLNWNEPSSKGNEDYVSYNLYVNGELFLNVGASTAYRYTVEGTDAETISFYVTALNSRGESIASNTVTLNFDAARPVPSGTINLSTIENGTTAIRLIINHNLQEADSLEIRRAGVLIRTIPIGTSPQSFEDIGLEPDTRYCYKVIAINDSGAGTESNESCTKTLEDTTVALPGPVRSLRATDIRTNSIAISWLAPENPGSSPITHYRVCSSTDNNNFVCVNETDLDYLFSSLSMSTVYYLRVSAVSAAGEGPAELLRLETLGTGVVPIKPVLQAEQTEYESPFEVSLYLDLPNLIGDVITSYVIEKSTDNITFNAVQTNNSPQANNIYRDTASLVDGSTYYYRARTTNSVGNSAYSDVVSVTIVDCEKRQAVISNLNIRFKDATERQKQTASWILYDRTQNVDGEGTNDPCGGYVFEGPKDLSKVRNLSVIHETDTQADIEWEPPRFLGGYPIAYYEVDVVDHAFNQNVTGLNTTLMGLEPATMYTVRVRPVNTFGNVGPWSSVDFTTLGVAPPPSPMPPGPPTNLRITASFSAIDKLFEWNAPSEAGTPPFEGYRLNLNGTEIFVIGGSRTRIPDLLYNTNYVARVQAYQIINQRSVYGPYSESFSFTTPEGIPAPPRNIRLSVVNETSIKVDWDAPRVTNGVITGYTIYYRELLSGDAWTQESVGNVLTDTIEGFEKGKTYEFDMTASTSAGESVTTNQPVTITISQYSVPGAPDVGCEEVPPPPE